MSSVSTERLAPQDLDLDIAAVNERLGMREVAHNSVYVADLSAREPVPTG